MGYNRRRRLITRWIGAGALGGGIDLEGMTLGQAMLYLCDVVYWPMTESSGNFVDLVRSLTMTYTGDITLANYQLPNGDYIPSFGGATSECFPYSTTFRDAFPYNKGSLICVCRVPSIAVWETNDGIVRYLCSFGGAPDLLYIAKNSSSSVQAYRDSNFHMDFSGRTMPVVIGVTWDTGTGLMITYVNGRASVNTVGGQVSMAQFANNVYVRIGSNTTFGDNNWIGQIGHFGLSNRVLTQAQFKAIYSKIITTTERRVFIIGDSKSTGANFWPCYLHDLLSTQTGHYWTDGPRRYAIGGYSAAKIKTFMDNNLANETDIPEAVLINIGTNDVPTPTEESTFKAAYNGIIDLCQAKWPGVSIYCQHVYRADSAQRITNSGIINGYINDCITAQGGSGAGVYLGPQDDVYIENGDAGATYLAADKIHYSLAAHQVIAAQWLTALGY